MTAWLLLFLVAMSVTGLYLLDVLTIVDTTVNNVSVVRNSGQMERVVSSLRAAGALSNDGNGRVVLPAPDTGGSYPQLPADFRGLQETPWGVPYQYCPYAAPAVGTADATLDSQGQTYDVAYLSVGSEQYVAESDDHPDLSDDVLGLLIATPPNVDKADMPSCQDVQKSGSAYTVTDGIVRAVTSQTTMLVDTGQSSGTLVVNAAPSASGDADGSSPGDAMTLEAALGRFYATRPDHMRIRLADGTYKLTDSELGNGAARRKDGATLELVGTGKSNVTLQSETGSVFDWVVKANLTARDLTIGPKINIETVGREVKLKNGTFPQMLFTQTDVLIEGDNEFVADQNYALFVGDGSTLNVSGTNVLDMGSAVGSAMEIDNGFVHLTGGGTTTLKNGNSSFSTHGFFVEGGRIEIAGQSVNIDLANTGDGFRLEDGELHIHENSTVSFGVSIASVGVRAENSDLRVDNSTITYPAGAGTGLDLYAGSSAHVTRSFLGKSGEAPTNGIVASASVEMLFGDSNNGLYAGTCFKNRTGKPDLFTGNTNPAPPDAQAEIKNEADSLPCN